MTISRLLDTTSRRTGRELLSSSGSHQVKHSSRPDLPMYEEVHALSGKPLQELTRLEFVTSKALELTLRPRYERLSDVMYRGIQRRVGIARL